MSYRIPTTQELYEEHLARLETELAQESPLLDVAFLRVLAITEAGLDIGHYKFAANAVLQNLALTATGTGLDRIGNDNDTPRKGAEAAILTATLTATTGTEIPSTTDFYSDVNGLRYRPEETVTAAAGVATLSLKCTELGTAGNMDVGNTFSIASQIAGAETVATVTVVDTVGAEEESDADYRPRVLFAQRAVTGGANATDHKIWAEEVSGVRRTFPYAGRPASEGASVPGDRLIYVEATTDIDSDGIAPGALLDSIRDSINTDPDTGLSRSVLGLTDDTLFIESISRTAIIVTISDLTVDASEESACKSDIEDALDLYLRNIAPFIDGVDAEIDRNDSITNPSVNEIVQDVLKSYGATAELVRFGLVAGVYINLYFLDPGELTKLGSMIYV